MYKRQADYRQLPRAVNHDIIQGNPVFFPHSAKDACAGEHHALLHHTVIRHQTVNRVKHVALLEFTQITDRTKVHADQRNPCLLYTSLQDPL